MTDPNKSSRPVAIADHIWNTFDDMASQMGSDRDALINQAMFMFARLNGFLETAAPRNGTGAAAPAAAPAGRADRAPSQIASAPPARKEPNVPPLLKPSPAASSGSMDDDPGRRAVADRVLQTAAELERLIKAKNQPPPPVSEPSLDHVNDNEPPADEGGGDLEPSSESGGHALYMQVEGGELDRIAKERFVIGRGKHCDFVVNSGKVSREHAVIIHEGSEFFIEDLGSSNGTWFNKQRIKRRRIEDGDEYFICSEKVKFVYR